MAKKQCKDNKYLTWVLHIQLRVFCAEVFVSSTKTENTKFNEYNLYKRMSFYDRVYTKFWVATEKGLLEL